MAVNVSKTPNIVQLAPVSPLVMPTSYTVVGSPVPNTAVGALADASDSTYVQEANSIDHLMYYKVASTQMPSQSRVVYARAVARAYRAGSGPVKRRWNVALGDNTTKAGLQVNGTTGATTLNTTIGQYSSTPRQTLSDNTTAIDQTQISKGLALIVGCGGGTNDNITYRTTQGYVELSYDQPPTATITNSGTFNDTSSPLITWDYFDDLQPQSEYVLAIVNSSGQAVYGSGHVKTSNTFHQVTQSLPNGNYTVQLRVYQAWNGPGGVFPAVNLATGSFSVNVLPLPTPNLVATTKSVGANYLTGDVANFANSINTYNASIGNIYWTGNAAGLVQNPGFADASAVYNTGAYHWAGTFSAGGSASVTRVVDSVRANQGNTYLALTATPSTYANAYSDFLPVNPGASYTLKVNYGGSVNSAYGVYFRVAWFRYDGSQSTVTQYSDTVSNGPLSATATNSLVSSVLVTAPSDAMYAQVNFYYFSPQVGGTLYIDNANLTASAPTLPYSKLILNPTTLAGTSFDLSGQTLTPLTVSASAKPLGSALPSDVSVALQYYDVNGAFLAATSGAASFVADPNNVGYYRVSASDLNVPPAGSRTVNVLLVNNNSTNQVLVDDVFLGVYNTNVSLAAKNYQDNFATSVFVNNHINLLNFDDSSFDNGYAGWQSISNATLALVATPIVDGTAALRVTVPSAGTAKVGQYAAAIKWSPNLKNVGIAVQVNGPATATGKNVSVTAAFYDANFALISTTSSSAAASAGYSPYRLNAAVPANTAYVSAQVSVSGCAANDVFYIDDVLVTDYVDSNVAWSRGGVITNTVNLLSYDDSTMNVGNNWIATNTNSVVTTSTDQARQGATSLKVTSTAAVSVGANLNTNGSLIPIGSAYGFKASTWVYSPSVSRTAYVSILVFDANGVPLTAYTTSGNATTVGAWTQLSNTVTTATILGTSPTAAFVNVQMYVSAGASGEVQYFDTVALSPLANASQYSNAASLGWQPGQYPNTDAAPKVHVEYTEDGKNYSALADAPLLDSNGNFSPIIEVTDYQIKSGTPRTYGATIAKQSNGTQLTSAEGFSSATSLTLRGTWLHAQTDAADTIVQYTLDGAGRQEDVQVISAATVVQGRDYPFSEFSTQKAASLQVQLALTSIADKVALDALANYQGNVVLRDQRGREYIGAIGSVSYTDAAWGSTAAFTITQAGT